jgi:DSF synthase
MGAYSFLTKKVGYAKANEIIHSNKTYSAQEIFDMGIINKVCDDTRGLHEISTLIQNGDIEQFSKDPFLNICNKVSKDELMNVVNVWLDRAFKLEDSNLSRMTKLANFQQRKIDQSKAQEAKLLEEQTISEVNSLINSSF